MRFPPALHRGRLVRRYKRFLADMVLEDGAEITAHCANPGSMMGVAPEGATVWVSAHHGKGRKLPWSWELVEIDGALVAINANNPNRIAYESIAAGAIPELSGYAEVRREVKYGRASRIDLLLEGGRRRKPCYVEVKNVHLVREPGLAEFPDSVTARGAKHLVELTEQANDGARAVMLFIVQRGDCRRFRPAADLDPAYAQGLAAAVAAGIEVLCYDCAVTTEEVVLRRALPVLLD
ncbi:MAG: DNA/RNA nuclease SfsA [Parvularculaceae bacterium]